MQFLAGSAIFGTGSSLVCGMGFCPRRTKCPVVAPELRARVRSVRKRRSVGRGRSPRVLAHLADFPAPGAHPPRSRGGENRLALRTNGKTAFEEDSGEPGALGRELNYFYSLTSLFSRLWEHHAMWLCNRNASLPNHTEINWSTTIDKRRIACNRSSDGAWNETCVGGLELEPIGTKTRNGVSVSL